MKMMTPPLACMASGERMPDREWVRIRTQSREPRNLERGRGVKIGLLDADKVDWMGR